jgi:hypothetical protein
MLIGFNYQLNPSTQQMLIIITIFMDWTVLGLFRPLQECVGVSVSAAGALRFIAFLGFILTVFLSLGARFTVFFSCAHKLKIAVK